MTEVILFYYQTIFPFSGAFREECSRRGLVSNIIPYMGNVYNLPPNRGCRQYTPLPFYTPVLMHINCIVVPELIRREY